MEEHPVKKAACCIIALIFAAAAVFGQSTPAEVVAAARIFGPEESARMLINMTAQDGSGSKRRKIEVCLERKGGESRLYAAIVDPAFLSGMKYLRISKDGGGLQQWMKTSRGVTRVVGSGANEKVFGSDFTAEDFGDVSPRDFELRFADAAELDAGTVGVIAKPIAGNASYAWKLIRIDSATRLVKGIDYHDAKGRLIRKYRLEGTSLVDDQPCPRNAVMRDEVAGSVTTLIFEEVKQEKSFPARIFSPAGL
jgi:hypothetical protein